MLCYLLQSIEELHEWDGQSPPTYKHQKGKVIIPKIEDVIGKSLPAFGPYNAERKKIVSEYKKSINPSEEFKPEQHRPAHRPSKPVPTVKVREYPLFLVLAFFVKPCDLIICTTVLHIYMG